MLVICEECGLNVSDKAESCPHCGFPRVAPDKQRKPRSTRRRRLPNGFGQISEIKGKRLRKPFRAMVSVGKDENGRPICKLLKPEAYFETYNDAYEALLKYHKDPRAESVDITFSQLYSRWSEEHFKTLKNPRSAKGIESVWKHCTELYDVRVKEMNSGSLKDYIQALDTTIGNKRVIRNVLNMMYDYATEYGIVDKNYSRNINFKGQLQTERNDNAHTYYTEEEMNILWKQCGKDRLVDMILVQCYTGFRPQELCNLRLENIDIENRVIVGGMKTAAGTDRKVPIHDRIYAIVKRWYDRSEKEGCSTLFSDIDHNYHRHIFRKNVAKLGLNPCHKPHDGRVHFVTMAKEAGLDEYSIKLIVGHAITDLTERVYTKRNINWLKAEMAKIP